MRRVGTFSLAASVGKDLHPGICRPHAPSDRHSGNAISRLRGTTWLPRGWIEQHSSVAAFAHRADCRGVRRFAGVVAVDVVPVHQRQHDGMAAPLLGGQEAPAVLAEFHWWFVWHGFGRLLCRWCMLWCMLWRMLWSCRTAKAPVPAAYG